MRCASHISDTALINRWADVLIRLDDALAAGAIGQETREGVTSAIRSHLPLLESSSDDPGRRDALNLAVGVLRLLDEDPAGLSEAVGSSLVAAAC